MSLYSKFGFTTSQSKITLIPTNDVLDEPEHKEYGSACWISDKKKNTYTDIKDGAPSGMGLWIGGGFFHHKEGNLVSIAPPGTGKGAALIIPNLLWKRHYPHSFVVFDPKGTNACITARFQSETCNQKVYIVDPMGLQKLNGATHDIPSSNFNPLDHIKHDIFNGAAQIANLLIPDDPNGERFWNQDGRNLVQAIIMHIMTDDEFEGERNLVSLYKEMLSGDMEDLLSIMMGNEELNGAIADFATAFHVMLNSRETFNSVRAVANGSIKWLSNPALQACMRTSDFKPEDLEKGGTTLYLCQPIQNIEGFATFSRLIVGFCVRANSKPTSKTKAWVYYLLDEFPTMGVFPEVIQALAFSREYRMRIWIFTQSISYLDWIYKEHARNQILGTARVIQAFGSTDIITQDYISRRIGLKTIKFVTKSYATSEGSSKVGGKYTIDTGASQSSGTSTTSAETLHGVPLISPQEVHYDPGIITITEWGPMRLSRWQYWQKDKLAETYYTIFNSAADKNPNIENLKEF